MNDIVIRVNKETRIVHFLTIPDNDLEGFLERNKEDSFFEFYILKNTVVNYNNVYKYINNELILDKEETDNEKYFFVKEQAKTILSKTDFLVLPDYAIKFTEIELNTIYDYRQSLRESTTELPLVPDFISKYLI